MVMEFRLATAYDVYRSYRDVLASAKAGEDAGFTALFRGDHILSVDGHHEESVTEAWTCLAGLARETTTLRLGTLVSPVTFRHPAMLARIVATVDEMSDGRAEVGLGAGWYDAEHNDFGLPLPPWPERFDHLEEQLEIVRGLLSGQPVNFEGRHYRITDGQLGRQVGERGRVPIVVGGNGRPRTLRLAARYGDEFNLDQITDLEVCVRAYAGLAEGLRAEGRPSESVNRSNVVPWPDGDFGAARARYAALEAIGTQRLYVRRTMAIPIAEIARFSREFIVRPAVT